MNARYKRPLFNLVIFVLGFFVVPILSGCGDGYDDSGPASISGQVVGAEAQGGIVELLDSSGNILATSENTLESDGTYYFNLNAYTPFSDEYLIVRVTQDGRFMRALITGFPGRGDYAGEDAIISPDTEAAIQLCTLGEYISIYDYAQFLHGTENGIFDENLSASLLFPYREVHDLAAAQVTSYFEGLEPLPSAEQINQLIEENNHVITESIPVDDPTDLPEVNRAFTTPDGDARIVVSYDLNQSQLIDSTPVSVSPSLNNEDGSFKWNTYKVDVQGNSLSSTQIRLIESDPEDAQKANIVIKNGLIVQNRTSETITNEYLTGIFQMVSSDANKFFDVDTSGIVVESDKINARFAMNFSSPLTAKSKVNLTLCKRIKSGEYETKKLMEFDGDIGKEKILSEPFSLTDQNNQDRLIIGTINIKDTAQYIVADFIDKTRYLEHNPMLVKKQLSETRVPGNTGMNNNIRTSHDDIAEPVDSGNVYSHYILDLDTFLKNNSVDGWKDTTYSKNIPEKERTPLVLIHGWEGDVGYRSAAWLSDWWQSPVNYFYKFISYYMGTKELYDKYHIYIAHWPSYKHLTFSGQMLKEMLDEAKTSYPNTDLGRGLNNENVGVVVITHSTGGLIFRSATEEHKAFASNKDHPYTYLRKAIILAAPNHGTPVATNKWPNNIKLAGKDLKTQSSSDLEWDSFDGASAFRYKILRFSYKDDRSSNRWVQGCLNTKQFDTTYLNKIGMTTKTYNPWLLSLNREFYKPDGKLNSKYILYSGWMRSGAWTSGNYIANGTQFKIAQSYIGLRLGYYNDAVLPLASNLFAKNTEKEQFYLPTSADDMIHINWYPYSKLYQNDSDNKNIIVIGSPKDHPLGMQFRILWDYDHDMIVNGALSWAEIGQIMDLIDKPLDAATGIDDAFYKTTYRQSYIRGAWAYSYGVVLTDEELEKKTNQLKADPCFLILRKDLLDAAPPDN